MILAMNLALTAYPMPSSAKRLFLDRIGEDVDYVSLAELKRNGLIDSVRRLRAYRPQRVFLPIEDSSSLAFLPLLKCAAALVGGRQIEVVSDLIAREKTTMSRRGAALSALGAVPASVNGLMSLTKCAVELRSLSAKALIDVVPRPARRVVYVNPNLWFGVKTGGSIGHTAGLINTFIDIGYAVAYFSAAANPLVSAKAAYVELRPPRRFSFPYELNRFRFHNYIVNQASEYGQLHDCSFVYQRLALSTYPGILLSRKYRVPLVLEYNSSEVWVAKNWGGSLHFSQAAEAAEVACLCHSHVVVTVSRVLQDELIGRGVPSERIVCYPNCVDPDAHDPSRINPSRVEAIRTEICGDPAGVLIGFIGTFGQWHGVEVLARAIAKLVENHRSLLLSQRVKFALVGDGPTMTQVRNILAGEALSQFVTLTGLVPQDDAKLYLAACDILMSPHVPNVDGSRFFGSPTKLFEYMAMGKAIIASDLDQIGDVLKDSLHAHELPASDLIGPASQVGVLCGPGDADDMIRAILFLCANPAWRSALGANARQEVLRHYTWKQHVAAILQRLRDLQLVRDECGSQR